MEKLVKISVQIPAYLNKWADEHDISKTALIVAGLRKQFLEENNLQATKIIDELKEILNTKNKLPF